MPRSTRIFKKMKNVGRPLLGMPRPSSVSVQPRSVEVKHISSSTNKINDNLNAYSKLQTSDCEYIILYLVQLSKIFSNAAVCKSCGGTLKVSTVSNI